MTHLALTVAPYVGVAIFTVVLHWAVVRWRERPEPVDVPEWVMGPERPSIVWSRPLDDEDGAA